MLSSIPWVPLLITMIVPTWPRKDISTCECISSGPMELYMSCLPKYSLIWSFSTKGKCRGDKLEIWKQFHVNEYFLWKYFLPGQFCDCVILWFMLVVLLSLSHFVLPRLSSNSMTKSTCDIQTVGTTNSCACLCVPSCS